MRAWRRADLSRLGMEAVSPCWSVTHMICDVQWTCLFVLGDDVGKERRVDLDVVSALL